MTITTRQQVIQQIGLGKVASIPLNALVPTTATTAAATSGFITGNIHANAIGTTYPNTIVGFPSPISPTDNFRTIFSALWNNTTSNTGYIGRFYKIGTVDFTVSGNSFTHDTATFPMLRTNLFGSNQAISLWPVLYITTATTTTAPAFTLATSGGAAGYVNQAGSSVIGTKTFTLPAAATAIQSAYFLRTEDDGTSGVQDITQMNMTTTAAVGTGTVYGFEKLATISCPFNGNAVYDGLLGCLDLRNHTPAVATSGTATSFLGALMLNGGTPRALCGNLIAARDA